MRISAFLAAILMAAGACMAADAPQSVTFKVSDVTPAKKPYNTTTLSEGAKLLGAEFEAISQKDAKIIIDVGNPFMSAVMTAFGSHRPLKLSPDHIWLLIEQGFSAHLGQNMSLLKKKGLAKFNAQKIKLTVRRDDFVPGSQNNPWNEVVEGFVKKIDESMDKKLSGLLIQKFSTTTPVETTAFGVVMMDSMKDYFDYDFETLCGIPSITLEGTPEDWDKLAEAAWKLRDFDLAWWIDEIHPLLLEFAKASRGQPTIEIWKSIFKEHEDSGGPYVNGWSVKFFPYILDAFDKPTIRNPLLKSEGEKPLKLARIPMGLSSVPFTWTFPNGQKPMLFQSGFFGIEQDERTLALSPCVCWFVRSVPAETEPFWKRTLRRIAKIIDMNLEGR